MTLLALEASAKLALLFYLNVGAQNPSESFSILTECVRVLNLELVVVTSLAENATLCYEFLSNSNWIIVDW